MGAAASIPEEFTCPMTAEMELVATKSCGDFGRLGSVAFIVARDHPERVAIDAASLVDLFGRELHALEVLEPVALLPGSGCSDHVRRFVGSAHAASASSASGRNDFRRQLPPPLFRGHVCPRIDEAQA